MRISTDRTDPIPVPEGGRLDITLAIDEVFAGLVGAAAWGDLFAGDEPNVFRDGLNLRLEGDTLVADYVDSGGRLSASGWARKQILSDPEATDVDVFTSTVTSVDARWTGGPRDLSAEVTAWTQDEVRLSLSAPEDVDLGDAEGPLAVHVYGSALETVQSRPWHFVQGLDYSWDPPILVTIGLGYTVTSDVGRTSLPPVFLEFPVRVVDNDLCGTAELAVAIAAQEAAAKALARSALPVELAFERLALIRPELDRAESDVDAEVFETATSALSLALGALSRGLSKSDKVAKALAADGAGFMVDVIGILGDDALASEDKEKRVETTLEAAGAIGEAHLALYGAAAEVDDTPRLSAALSALGDVFLIKDAVMLGWQLGTLADADAERDALRAELRETLETLDAVATDGGLFHRHIQDKMRFFELIQTCEDAAPEPGGVRYGLQESVDRNGLPTVALTATATGTMEADTLRFFRETAHVTADLEAGDDITVLGTGDDRVNGGAGADRLLGRGGEDLLEGGRGRDTLKGGSHDDTIMGQGGTDRLIGGAGEDHLDGGGRRDTLRGGGDDDVLFGQRGRDRLIGQGGDDTLEGGPGRDVLFGGAGADTFLFDLTKTPRTGRDTVRDYDPAEDALLFQHPSGHVTIRTRTGGGRPARPSRRRLDLPRGRHVAVVGERCLTPPPARKNAISLGQDPRAGTASLSHLPGGDRPEPERSGTHAL